MGGIATTLLATTLLAGACVGGGAPRVTQSPTPSASVPAALAAEPEPSGPIRDPAPTATPAAVPTTAPAAAPTTASAAAPTAASVAAPTAASAAAPTAASAAGPNATPAATGAVAAVPGTDPPLPELLEACAEGHVLFRAGIHPALAHGLVHDCAVLLEARDRLAGAGAESLGWSADRPITTWAGVSVEQRRVTALSLTRTGSPGEIPAGLARLSELRSLSLGGELTGPIPPELGLLANLRVLGLSGGMLSGAIPAELGRLSSLEHLGLGGNQLSGEIPSELGRLSSLESLSLNGNQLSGEIPPELGQLEQLESLRLQGNQLTGRIPSSFATMRHLERLDLRDNELSGEIPSELSGLRNRGPGSLYLSGNQLTGCIPLPLAGALRDRHELGLPYCACPATRYERTAFAPELSLGADGIPFMPHSFIERAGTYRVTFSLVVDLPEGGNFALGRRYRDDAGDIVVRIFERKSHSSLGIDPFSGEERDRFVIEGPAGCDPSISSLFDHLVSSARMRPLDIPTLPHGIPTMYHLQPVEGGRTFHLAHSRHVVVDVPAGMLLTLENGGPICESPGGCYGIVNLWDERSRSVLSLTSYGEERWREIVDDASGRDIDDLFDQIMASLRRMPPPHEIASCDVPPTAGDCITLLEAKQTLDVGDVLNWSLERPLPEWDGVVVEPWSGRVAELRLRARGLNGQIPAALARLTGLATLDLSHNRLTGELPSELTLLAGLESLNVAQNYLDGCIPADLEGRVVFGPAATSGLWFCEAPSQ